MTKSKTIILWVTSLTLSMTTAGGLLFIPKLSASQTSGTTSYTLRIDEDNPLSGGNVLTRGGTNIHFDEYGVNESVENGLLELAAYGNIALQTYISGISGVEVWSEVGEGKDFCLTAGATPNSCEYTSLSYQSHASLDLLNGFEGDCFYFSVHNKTDVPILITAIEIRYSCVDSEAGLKKTIEDHLNIGQLHTYTGHPLNPYDGYEIDPSSIPSNRHLIKTMSEDEYPTAPGNYTFGYEVYDVDNLNQSRKLLYIKTNTFQIVGYGIQPPDERNVVTFHIPDENGKEKLICQQVNHHQYDITQLPTECLPYLWDSPYNNFNHVSDEHYYPVFRVNGISSMKEGDGCYPVNFTYSYFERGFSMPEPQMKPGYKFGGWYLDSGLTQIFDENKMHPGNLTLYAKCLETNLDVKRVYYHNEDGSLANHVDYLFSNDNHVILPEAENIMDLPRPMIPFYWAIFASNTYMGLYKQSNTSSVSPTQGDKIKYSDFSGHAGDVHVYATELIRINESAWSYDLFSQDVDGNNIYQHTMMARSYKSDYDFVIPGFAVRPRDNYEYHDQADNFPISRIGQFFMTDEKKAYLMDGGTLKTISSYGYGNIEMNKPLEGILRHELVQKVGRRAFFNRYGLKGTYFPRNATEFEIEAYANVKFNNILTLPKTLTKIGDRCFMGSTNISYVCLPKTLKTVGPHAFAFGIYNYETRVFEHISNRYLAFLYEGSEKDFNTLDEVTKAAIRDNASTIIYNYDYGTYYGRG